MRDPCPVPTTAAAGGTSELQRESCPGTVRPVALAEPPAQAQGRRILSTAFVRVGVEEYLMVELLGGRVVVLRDVTMGRDEYCGVEVVGGVAGKRRCGGYSEIVSARPGRG